MHLQCHIGTDTISLARLGARMTGLDFSPASLAEARRLAATTGADVEFVESDVYAAADVLGAGRFDLVFTGIGALCWLPDIRPLGGGRVAAPPARRPPLHPRGPPGALGARRRSAGRAARARVPVLRDAPSRSSGTSPGTYVETDVEFKHNLTHEWNHGLGEISTSVSTYVPGLVPDERLGRLEVRVLDRQPLVAIVERPEHRVALAHEEAAARPEQPRHDSPPAMDVGQPAERADAREDEVEPARAKDVDRGVEVGLHERDFRASLLRESARLGERGGEVEPGDPAPRAARARSCPSRCGTGGARRRDR